MTRDYDDDDRQKQKAKKSRIASLLQKIAQLADIEIWGEKLRNFVKLNLGTTSIKK